MIIHRPARVLTLGWVAALAASVASAQRVGQSATVQFGTVQHAETVRLDSDAAKGALIGGTLGLAVGGSRGRGSPARNGILGAAIGGLATGVAQRNRTAKAYTVAMNDGSATRVVTDQREIRPGDCVAVERAGQTANIRRQPRAYCDRANDAAIRSIEPAPQQEALLCEGAKQELADATNKEEAELASRKIELLCGG